MTALCSADVMLMQNPVPGIWEGNRNRGVFLSQETAHGATSQIWQKLLLNSVQIGEGEGGDFNFHTKVVPARAPFLLFPKLSVSRRLHEKGFV